MKLYTCSVKLGDSNNHIVPNKIVTIPEIAVLKRVHGDAAVFDIRPHVISVEGKGKKPELVPQVKRDKAGGVWTDAQERERLTLKYQRGDDSSVNISALFGAMGALPKTLREIGIDPQAAAAEMRRRAEEMAASAARLADEDAPPVDEDEEAFFADENEKAA